MNILSEPSCKKSSLLNWVKTKKPNKIAIDLIDSYWDISVANGVDPVITFCQSMHETGYLKFGGVLTTEYKNTCGLKNSKGGGCKDPNAHAKFNSWEDGIAAQVQHLALYAGKKGYPLNNPLDPRHFPYLLGKCTTLQSLDGNWAGQGYGAKILKLIDEVKSLEVETSNDIISQLNSTIQELQNKLNTIKKIVE